ncbi:MAG TPA: aminotransferase class V-fold PLP-dependent enzyme, partial [Candidatus Polarisedimenticolia bacterium]|nr:aminotransferase class V-fold PLP-dependent enzyme [Candidatus Polarisedimenticolia bacterium]
GVARLIGAAPGTVQVQPSTSVALSVVASCLDFSRGGRRKVVTGAHDFPTSGYVWEEQRRLGAEVIVVPSVDGLRLSTERLLEAIDRKTCLVALSHVSYLSSHRLDPRPIIARAHEKGALVLLDIYQSAGLLPIEAAAWGVDFLIGGTIKWLCGGPACGYLYVRPDLMPSLRPRVTGWFAHAAPFDFAHGAIRYDDGVRRFAQGTPPIPALYACLPGLEIIAEVGLPVIEAESRRRTDMMIAFATERGWRINTPRAAAERGGCVMIGVDRPREIVERLRERRVLVDWRPGVGLRLSPHFFNTDAEVGEALEILSRILG